MAIRGLMLTLFPMGPGYLLFPMGGGGHKGGITIIKGSSDPLETVKGHYLC